VSKWKILAFFIGVNINSFNYFIDDFIYNI